MSEIEEEAPARSKFWIWFLVIILVGLLMVPVLSIGLALKKTGWTPVSSPKREQKVSQQGSSTSSEAGLVSQNPQNDSMSALRERIEKVAASVIKPPKLRSKMQQVQIQASSAPSINKASEAVHNMLRDRNHQFVEAISQDSIKIVVILPSNQWPELSASLQNAAEKDGFIYRGPSQTSTTASGADTLVAEIEILRKPANDPKAHKN
jgi:hypothetical protein